jgi:hypothetical protein
MITNQPSPQPTLAYYSEALSLSVACLQSAPKMAIATHQPVSTSETFNRNVISAV